MNKLTCKDVCLLLSLYIDDMLSDEEMTQVREHLDECDNCRNEYALLKGIMEKSAQLECPELSPSFMSGLHEKLLCESQLMDKTDEEETEAVIPVRKWRIYPYIAAGAAAIVISVLALSNLPDSDSFISDNKNEFAMPMQTQESEQIESVEPALASNSPAPTEETEETSGPEETEEANADIDERTLESDDNQDLSEEGQNKTEELNSEIEEVARSTPKMASLVEGEVQETAEDTADVAEAEKAAQVTGAASGGGSTAVEEKVRISVIFSFNHESAEQVREAMSGVRSRGAVYEVPVSSLSEYVNMLQSMEGYIAHRQVEEDYTSEYSLLVKNGDVNGRMAQIDEYTEYATIMIGS